MSVLELIQQDPHFIGYVDSSGMATGGVWTSGTKAIKNNIVLWRFQWSQEIQNELDSAKIPRVEFP